MARQRFTGSEEAAPYQDGDHDEDDEDNDDNIGLATLQCMRMCRVDRSRQRHIGFDQKYSKEPSCDL